MFVRAAANQLMTQLLHFAWREKTATAHDFKNFQVDLATAVIRHSFFFAQLCFANKFFIYFPPGLFSNGCSPTHLSTLTPDSQFEWV